MNAEHERLQTMYSPLTQSVRRLIEAGIRTDVDEATLREAQSSIEAAVEKLGGAGDGEHVDLAARSTGGRWRGRNPGDGTPQCDRAADGDPHEEPDGMWWSEFDAGAAVRGSAGLGARRHLRAGARPLLGEAASDGLTKPLFTGTITLRYLRGTPLGRLRAEAFIERTEGFKTFARGHLVRRRRVRPSRRRASSSSRRGRETRDEVLRQHRLPGDQRGRSRSPRPQTISATTGWASPTM